MKTIKQLVYTLAMSVFAVVAISSCDKDVEMMDESQVSEVSGSYKDSVFRQTRASEWFSLPEWQGTIGNGKTFHVKSGHKVLVTAINLGKVYTKVFVKQVGTGIPDDIMEISPAQVNSVVIESCRSKSVHVLLASAESDGSFAGSKVAVRVSYLR